MLIRNKYMCGASSTPNVTPNLGSVTELLILNIATLCQPLVGFQKIDVLIYLGLEPTDGRLNGANEPCSGTICCLFFRFALWAVLNFGFPRHALLVLETVPLTGRFFWSHLPAFMGGVGPPTDHWPRWKLSYARARVAKNLLDCFFQQGDKIQWGCFQWVWWSIFSDAVPEDGLGGSLSKLLAQYWQVMWWHWPSWSVLQGSQMDKNVRIWLKVGDIPALRDGEWKWSGCAACWQCRGNAVPHHYWDMSNRKDWPVDGGFCFWRHVAELTAGTINSSWQSRLKNSLPG